MPVFPVLRSFVQHLRRFSNILRNCVIAWLQLLETLVRDSLCLSKTLCVSHRYSVSLTYSLYLSQTVCVCQRQSVSVTDSLFLSQIVCVCCHRKSLSASLCLYQTLLIILGLIFTYLYMIFIKIWVCPEPQYKRYQLCWPLMISMVKRFVFTESVPRLIQSISHNVRPLSVCLSVFLSPPGNPASRWTGNYGWWAYH